MSDSSLPPGNYTTPYGIVRTFFRSLRTTVADAHRLPEGEDKRDRIVVVLLLSVAAVEAFINVYFRVLADETEYAEHQKMILEDLHPAAGGKGIGLKKKLDKWPPKVFGKPFKWQTGVAAEFDRIRERRNALMHFTSSHQQLSSGNMTINGLSNTEAFDTLSIQDADTALRTAEGMLEEVFRMRGASEADLQWGIFRWTGKHPSEA